MSNEQPAEKHPGEPSQDELEQIARALRGLRFGYVNVIVQDGLVIQIERTEKRRLRSRGDLGKKTC